jgi:hypothetical protein
MVMHNGDDTLILAVDFVAYLDFVTYSLDPSRFSNPSSQVLALSQPNQTLPIPLDPAWTLAAWSVDEGGILPATSVAGQSVYNQLISYVLAPPEWPFVVTNPSEGVFLAAYYQDTTTSAIVLPPILQTLSLVDYSVTRSLHDIDSTSNVPHPLLFHYGSIYAWAYGMNSRTAYLGVVVVLMGMMIVAVQCALSILDGLPSSKGLTQFLAAALAHVPQGEFDATGNDEDKIAALNFRVTDSVTRIGQLEYHKM